MRPLCAFASLLLGLFSYAQTPTIVARHVIAGNCSAVAFGNGVWVASSSSGTFTSEDAKAWGSLNSDSVPAFSFLVFGDGVFVGIGNFSAIYSSNDGTHWTLRGETGGIVSGLSFTHGVFYAVSGSTITKSSDGITWAPLDLGVDLPTPAAFGGINYNGSVYVIGVTVLATRGFPLGSSGVLYSMTGEPGSWTFADVSAAPPVSNVQWVKDRFYLFAQDGIYSSTDGIAWGTPSPALTDTGLDGRIVPAGGSVFLTVGDSVYLIGGASLEVSTDGTHFKSLVPPALQAVGGLAGNGLTLIYGNGGIATATDGINFRLNGTLFSALASNGSGYVAAGLAGSGGPLFFSPDFVAWTQQPPVSASMVVYDGSRYMATGSGNTYVSANGTNWSNSPVDISFTAMDYGAGRYVAGTFYSLLSSSDAVNWSEVDSGYNFYYKIRYLNNNFFALGMNFGNATGVILRSSDGLHWQDITPQSDSAVTYYNDVMYDGTRYYFTGRKNWMDFFTLSTTDPGNTASYGAMGGIGNPAEGTAAVDYFPQFDDFIYHDGHFVGTAVDGANGLSYLLCSTDGMNWTTAPLGGSGHVKTIVSASDVYHMVGDDGGYYTVSFVAAAPPVLLRFDAEAVPSFGGENSRLNWETKNDSGVAYYLVQHSLDTIHWDSIGRVNAAERGRERRKAEVGETGQEKEIGETERYQFIHDDPPAGANFYRLGVTDRAGRRWWSPVRRVDISDMDILIYPNPARGVIHVQLPSAGKARLVVVNSAWMPVRQRVANGREVSIDLRSLPEGTYYLLVYQDGKRYTREFILGE